MATTVATVQLVPVAVVRKAANSIEKFIDTDNKVRLNTGLPNKDSLNALYEHLAKKAGRMRHWCGAKKTTSTMYRKFRSTPKKFGPKRKLRIRDELVLVLMKLRLGLTNEFLATIFSISVTTCSQIFNTWIPFLAKELKPLIFWPDKVTATADAKTSLTGLSEHEALDQASAMTWQTGLVQQMRRNRCTG